MRTAALALVALLALGCSRAPVDAQGKPITSGRFRLRTNPKGAQVWIDGELKVESTPATLILPAGEYQLRIQIPGAEPVERTIVVEAGRSRELNLSIPAAPPARLSVLSDVVGAEVRINGYKRGETPLAGVAVRPGPIDVTVTTPWNAAKSVQDHLRSGESRTLEVFFAAVVSQVEPPEPPVAPPSMSLPPPQGYLTLGLEPNGRAFLEEAGGERPLGETPLSGLPLEPGSHRVVLRSKDGRYEKRVTIEVQAEKRAVYRFMLRAEDELPGWAPDAGAG